MGYQTHYTLSYTLPKQPTKSELNRFKHQLKAHGIDVPSSVNLDEVTLESELQFFKDMARMSNKFPTVLFTLRGEGEKAGDLWIKYYRGGKVQGCKGIITYDDFDPSKLEEIE